jgi:hypothetical protein
VTAAADSAEPVGVRECVNCHQVRRVSALRETARGWQCAEPCRNPGGRPPVGPPVLIRMAPELRAGIKALGRERESLAATARRLLAAAVAAAPQRTLDDAFDPEDRPAGELIEWLATEADRLSDEIDDPAAHAGPGAVGLQQSLALVLAHISNEFVHGADA